LRAALESLTRQKLTHGSLEVVLADDGSNGELDQCVRDFSAKFAGFQMVSGPNAGPGVARNRGVAAARGQVVIFTDSDCIATPEWAENMTVVAENHHGYVHGPVLSSVPAMPPFVHSFMVHDELLCGGNFGLKRSIFLDVGGFDPAISRVGEDHDIAERFRKHGIPGRYVGDAIIIHPPRLARIGLPTEDSRYYQALREFYRVNTGHRASQAAGNRKLLRGALLKLGTLTAPAVLAPLFPPFWPLGLVAMLAHTMRQRHVANRTLRQAGETFSVPLTAALRRGLIMPVEDLLPYLFRVKYGIGGLSQDALDRALDR